MNKTQILIIHGGETFKTYEDYINFLKTRKIRIERKIRWHDDYLRKSLGENFYIVKPRMPLQDNAKYDEWKIHFEKYISQLDNNLILMGISLGGIFLARYLSENKLTKKNLFNLFNCSTF